MPKAYVNRDWFTPVLHVNDGVTMYMIGDHVIRDGRYNATFQDGTHATVHVTVVRHEKEVLKGGVSRTVIEEIPHIRLKVMGTTFLARIATEHFQMARIN